MAKVLVLYYSAYGHIETMAALSPKAPPAPARRSTSSACPSWSGRSGQGRALPARPARTGGHRRRAGRLRRHRHRHRHPLRPDELADGQLPRPGRRPVGARRAARQGRLCVHLHRHPARRPGDHAVLDHHQPAALRHGDRRPGLRPRRADDLDEITGGSPYGSSTIAGGDGSRQPTDNELQGARYRGRVVAETAIRLHG